MYAGVITPHAPPRLEVPSDGTPVGGWIVRERAENDPKSDRTRVLLECTGCGAVEPRAAHYLRKPSGGCAACLPKRRNT
jgi:hypothetical protein